MPAFDEALSGDEIQRVLDHVRGFCRDRRWPHGNLNRPRPLVTEKAFPEDEVVARVSSPYVNFVGTDVVYERRVGARGQLELVMPFNVHRTFGGWQRGLGDVKTGYKHVLLYSLALGSVLTMGADVTFPTGKEALGLGNRLTIFEPFVVFSQVLPFGGFAHAQVGLEAPLNLGTPNDEIYWRAAIGRTFVQGQWGRRWSPILEVLGSREREFGALPEWDVLPQLHVTLSSRQHVSANAGIRLPVTLRTLRRAQPMLYLQWDWFDGSLFDGWR